MNAPEHPGTVETRPVRPEDLVGYDMIRRLVAFPTVSRDSNLELIGWVRAYLEDLGATTRLTFNDDRRKANLFATFPARDGNATTGGIVLSGHTDVVPVDGQPWNTDPFEATLVGDRLHGRGVTDMKSFSAIGLAFVPQFLRRGLARPLHFALSYDEEVGCIGVHRLIDDVVAQGVAPTGCIVGEPTGMQLVVAHKGKKSWRCRVRGHEAHSSLTPQGVNAVQIACEIVAYIARRAREFRDGTVQDKAYDVPYTTAHVGIIRGGTALNIVPRDCSFDFEFRNIPADDREALFAEVRRYAETRVLPEMRAVSAMVGMLDRYAFWLALALGAAGWAYIAKRGTPVFAYKGESLEEYWEFTHRIFEWGGYGGPNMILDDGGDATLLVHLGTQAEKDRSLIAHPGNEEEFALFAAIAKRLANDGTFYSRVKSQIRGVTEETTTGVKRLYQMHKEGRLGFPAINVNDSVTKSKFDNLYGCRESLVDGIKRATDVMIAGKIALVNGYGDVGKGSAQALRALSAQVWISEVDPICALQASMEGYRVVTMDYAADKADIFVTATGNIDVITHEHMKRMKNNAIVCNIGHFDNEIEVAALKAYKWENIKPQVDHIIFPDGKRIILLAEGRLVNLAAAEGHPAAVMDMSFANQALSAEYAVKHGGGLEHRVYVVPVEIDREIARLKLASMGVAIDTLTVDQAQYLASWDQGT